MWNRKKPTIEVYLAVYKYIFKRGARGVFSSRIYNALKSYDWDSVSDALAELRDRRIAHCTNHRWFIIDTKKDLTLG